MADIYELLTDIINLSGWKTINGDFTIENKQKLKKEYWKIYDLIENICSLVIDYHDDIAIFQPELIWEGKRTFDISDMTDEDFLMLEQLELDRLPTVLSYRISELLWSEQSNYIMATKAYKYAEALFDICFEANSWASSVEYLKRAIILTAKLNKKEEYQRLCSKCLDYAEKTDPKEGYYKGNYSAGLRIYCDAKLVPVGRRP